MWDSPYDPWSRARFDSLMRGTTVRAFVLDTTKRFYGGWPDSTTLLWLEANAHEVTQEVHMPGGKPVEGLRVFVRP